MSQQIVRQVGSFTGSGHTELLFYYPESGEWWLGSFSNQQLLFLNLFNHRGNR